MREEDETITTRISNHHAVRGFWLWLAIVGGIAVLFPIGYGLFLVRQYLPTVGIIWLAAISLVPILLVCWGIIALVGFATRADYQEITEAGGYSRDKLGRIRVHAPLTAIAPVKVSTRAAKVEVSLAVPSLFDLIEDGTIAPGNTDMVMGYDKVQLAKGALQLIVGPWPGTHAVAGKGRSGKTRRVLATIAQALISGAHVIICDPHYTKLDSLARSLEPLSKYITIARGEEEIVAASQQFHSEMEARVNTDQICTPWLIVYDEWSRLMDLNNVKMPEGGRDLLVDVAKNCSIQYAGYQGYCCVIGQIWTQEACGGTEIRRSLQSVFVHQLSAEYAAFFFKAAKWKNKSEELKRRECVYKDTDSQMREVVTIGVPDDTAMRVAAYLASIGVPELEAPYQSQMLEAPGEPFTTFTNSPEREYSPLRLLSSSGQVNTVNEPVKPSEDVRTFTQEGEYSQDASPEVSPDEEAKILDAVFRMQEENMKVTRTGIRDRLEWNNKQYPKIQLVCDKYGIATKRLGA